MRVKLFVVKLVKKLRGQMHRYMAKRLTLYKKRSVRANRVRKTLVRGNTKKPRLSVFRSNGHIYAQLVDDTTGKTLGSSSSLKLDKKGSKTVAAKTVGIDIAKKAGGLKIKTVIFDRGSYKYHGRVKALAEGAREGGLTF